LKPYFIDKNINICSGDEALEALKNENDIIFLNDGKGVVKVTIERWHKAQACEKKHWMIKGIKSANDRNDYHYEQFDKFRILKQLKFNSAIEIGCGPFTNARIIGRKCKINKITLLDPLLCEYLGHPFASYNEKYLYSEYYPIVGKVIRHFLPYIFKKYQNLFARKIKIQEILNLAAEKIQNFKQYDLVIMINVLEHCYDIEEIFSNILKISQDNAYFIFEDKLYDSEKVKNELMIGYDAAHPLKVDSKIIEKFLDNNFRQIYKRIQSNSINIDGEKITWDDIYFIGEKFVKKYKN
jgi:SAM-dependent methyltransferase